MAESSLKTNFESACKKAESLQADLSNDDKLILYGLFKQATVGDINTGKPGIFDPKGRAKWTAWDSRKGMSKDDAMKKYVEEINRLSGK